MGGCCCGGDAAAEPADLRAQARTQQGEVAAGYLRKRGRTHTNWSKRWFVLRRGCLVYYSSRDRAKKKGIVRLVNARVRERTDGREKAKDRFLFEIAHEHRATREFYADTKRERDQWIEIIQHQIDLLKKSTATEGFLVKLGGALHLTWQQRWFSINIYTGRLEYFDEPDAIRPMGNYPLMGAKIMPSEPYQKMHCFELYCKRRGKYIKRRLGAATRTEFYMWRDALCQIVEDLDDPSLAAVAGREGVPVATNAEEAQDELFGARRAARGLASKALGKARNLGGNQLDEDAVKRNGRFVPRFDDIDEDDELDGFDDEDRDSVSGADRIESDDANDEHGGAESKSGGKDRHRSRPGHTWFHRAEDDEDGRSGRASNEHPHTDASSSEASSFHGSEDGSPKHKGMLSRVRDKLRMHQSSSDGMPTLSEPLMENGTNGSAAT